MSHISSSDLHVYEGADHTLRVPIPAADGVPQAAAIVAASVVIGSVLTVPATAADGDGELIFTANISGAATVGKRGAYPWELAARAAEVRQTVARGIARIDASIVQTLEEEGP